MTRVLCCGMAVLDFVFEVDAMPDRAEKYRAKDARIIGGGGAANAAVAVSRLGGAAALAARLGADGIGDLITEELSREGVDLSHVARSTGARSSYSSILVDGAGERQIMNFRGEGLPDAIDLSDTKFDAALGDTRWVAGTQAVMARARTLGVPGVIDAEAPTRGAIPAQASHVAFSVQGLRDFTGEPDRDIGLLSAASELAEQWVCVTDGPEGVFFVQAGKIDCIPGFPVKVVDTLGAGDIWHGAFALCLGEGKDELEAARLANAAAALKCTGFGGRAATPTRAEVETFLEERK